MLFFWKDNAEKPSKPVYFASKGVKSDVCTFPNFSSMSGKSVAELGLCGNTKWTFSLEKQGEKTSVVLDCEPENSLIANRKEWTVEAEVLVRLVNHISNDKSLTLTAPKVQFHRRDGGSRWSHTFDDIFKDKMGFLNNDTVVLQLQVGITDIQGLYGGNFIDFSVPRAKETDAVLVVNGTKFHVSKKILSIQSPVFDTMFNGQFVETELNEVPIQNVDVAGFHTLLQFMYMGPVLICEENIAKMLELGDRFLVKRLVRECEEYLLQGNLDKEQVIELAIMFNLERLLCKMISKEKKMEVLVSDFSADRRLPPTAESYFNVRMGELDEENFSNNASVRKGCCS